MKIQSRREFITIVGILGGALFFLFLAAAAPVLAASRPPNIVLILADDLGAEALSCYGSQSCATPQLDRMAKEGVRFENAHVAPLCSPTRAELLTGRYAFRCDMTSVILPRQKHRRLDLTQHRTLANFLRDAGYATCIAGKWHLCYDFAQNPRHVAEAGFDDRYLWRLFRNDKITRNLWDPELWVNDRPADELGKGKYGPDLFSDHVGEFIKAHRDRPFFVYYPMVLAHEQTATGRNYPPTPDTLKPAADPHAGPRAGQPGFSEAFADNVAYLDRLVGKVDRALRDAGVRDNTLLIFLGDNGTTKGVNNRYRGGIIEGGKSQLNESGTRVPFLVNWPAGSKGGRVVRDLTDGVDVLPTALAAAGVPLPAGYQIDGQSFLPQLRGEPGQPREWVYKQLNQAWLIRTDRYRLNSDGRLWDLSPNPYAPTLVSASPATIAVRKRLTAAVKQLKGKEHP